MESGSSVPRRQLGRLLRQSREAAGLSMEAAARKLEWSKAKMYRIEGGQVTTALRTHDVLAMCATYQISPKLTEVLISLASEAKAHGWWHAYGDVIPDWFELYVGLESSASTLRRYEPSFISGLLQTRDYATAVLGTHPGTTEEETQRGVALRIERQKLLVRAVPPAPTLDVILDEAVLRRPIGDLKAMGRQLDAVVESSTATNITVRILPLATGPHHAIVPGAFVILDFASSSDDARRPEPTTIYAENLTGALYLDKPAEVRAYEQVWADLEALSLNPSRSRDLLRVIAKEYKDG